METIRFSKKDIDRLKTGFKKWNLTDSRYKIWNTEIS